MNCIELKTKIFVAPELWATNILPEGILERWISSEGRPVEVGDPVAIVRIESALHDIIAPAKDRLHINCNANAVVEPGSVIGFILREIQGTGTPALNRS